MGCDELQTPLSFSWFGLGLVETVATKRMQRGDPHEDSNTQSTLANQMR
jgi:hypothetical protein